MAKKIKSNKNRINSNISADEIIDRYNTRRKVKAAKVVEKKSGGFGIIPWITVFAVIVIIGLVTGLFSGHNTSFVTDTTDNSGSESGNDANQGVPVYDQGVDLTDITLNVYRTATCGCCHEFINYMRDLGATVNDNIEEQADLDARKASFGLTPDLYACHTTTVEGYFVEGHIPGFAISQLLAERPAIDGITTPGMPAGVAGMGGDKLNEVEVLAVSGSTVSVYVKY